MSMEIDLSSPLTSTERAYLAGRGRYGEIERADSMHGVTGVPLPDGDGTGPASYDVRDRRIAELEDQLALLRAPAEEEDDDGDGEEVEPYETWTVAKLDEELAARSLAVTGNKDSKVKALYADDSNQA